MDIESGDPDVAVSRMFVGDVARPHVPDDTAVPPHIGRVHRGAVSVLTWPNAINQLSAMFNGESAGHPRHPASEERVKATLRELIAELGEAVHHANVWHMVKLPSPFLDNTYMEHDDVVELHRQLVLALDSMNMPPPPPRAAAAPGAAPSGFDAFVRSRPSLGAAGQPAREPAFNPDDHAVELPPITWGAPTEPAANTTHAQRDGRHRRRHRR